MNNFVVKIQQPGAMKNSQDFKFTALADFSMAYVQDIHSFPDLKNLKTTQGSIIIV